MSDNQDLFEYCLDMIDSDQESQHPFDSWKGEGYCCFCNDECNPASQSCGPCMRNGNAMDVYFNY